MSNLHRLASTGKMTDCKIVLFIVLNAPVTALDLGVLDNLITLKKQPPAGATENSIISIFSPPRRYSLMQHARRKN
jgi:hypothetical protein